MSQEILLDGEGVSFSTFDVSQRMYGARVLRGQELCSSPDRDFEAGGRKLVTLQTVVVSDTHLLKRLEASHDPLLDGHVLNLTFAIDHFLFKSGILS